MQVEWIPHPFAVDEGTTALRSVAAFVTPAGKDPTVQNQNA